jgi:hypothetical protein
VDSLLRIPRVRPASATRPWLMRLDRTPQACIRKVPRLTRPWKRAPAAPGHRPQTRIVPGLDLGASMVTVRREPNRVQG